MAISNISGKAGVLRHQALAKEIPLETSEALTAQFTETEVRLRGAVEKGRVTKTSWGNGGFIKTSLKHADAVRRTLGCGDKRKRRVRVKSVSVGRVVCGKNVELPQKAQGLIESRSQTFVLVIQTGFVCMAS